MLLQAKHALATLTAAVAWGTPHVMWWELFDNTKVFTKNGTDKAELGIYEDRGFCLVDRNNKDSVLFKGVKQYISLADAWQCGQVKVAQVGFLSTFGCFPSASTGWLVLCYFWYAISYWPAAGCSEERA